MTEPKRKRGRPPKALIPALPRLANADDLERAIQVRDRIRYLDQFIVGAEGWAGEVRLSFGSYTAAIDSGDQFMRLLRSERARLLALLTSLGVQLSAEPS